MARVRYIDIWQKSCFLGPTIEEFPQPNLRDTYILCILGQTPRRLMELLRIGILKVPM